MKAYDTEDIKKAISLNRRGITDDEACKIREMSFIRLNKVTVSDFMLLREVGAEIK